MLYDRIDRELCALDRALANFSGELYRLEDLKIDYGRPEDVLKLHELRALTLLNLNRMAGAPDNEIMTCVLDKCSISSQSRFSILGTINESETIYTTVSWSKTVMAECVVGDPTLDFQVDGGGLWAEPIRQRRTVVVNDYSAAHPGKKGLPEGHVPLTRFMAVPVFERERIVCLGGVANKHSDYDDSDRKSFEAVLYDMWRLILSNRMMTLLKEKYEFAERMNSLLVGREITMEELKRKNADMGRQD